DCNESGMRHVPISAIPQQTNDECATGNRAKALSFASSVFAGNNQIQSFVVECDLGVRELAAVPSQLWRRTISCSHRFVTICYYFCIVNDWKPLATLGMRIKCNPSLQKGLRNLSALKREG
ncbi:MAG TPA: hypothetical protein VL498_06355, partial [Terracidiphilus sp.]|nr:hypothetical protein [Terracidiphilus sp.]